MATTSCTWLRSAQALSSTAAPQAARRYETVTNLTTSDETKRRPPADASNICGHPPPFAWYHPAALAERCARPARVAPLPWGCAAPVVSPRRILPATHQRRTSAPPHASGMLGGAELRQCRDGRGLWKSRAHVGVATTATWGCGCSRKSSLRAGAHQLCHLTRQPPRSPVA